MSAHKHKVPDDSYFNAIADTPFMYYSLPELLDKRARESGDAEAHVFRVGTHEHEKMGRVAITFEDLAYNSLFLAQGLLDLGLAKGDHILIVGHNCPEWVVLEYACLRVQMLLIRIPPEMACVKLVMENLVSYKCRAVVLDLNIRTHHMKRILETLKTLNKSKEVNEDARLMALRDDHGVDQKMVQVEDLIDESKGFDEVTKIQEAIRSDDIAIVLSTSGSSGFLLFAQLSHFAVINNTFFTEGQVIKSPSDRFFNDRPFSWIGSNMYTSVVHGMAMVHLDPAIGIDGQTSNIAFQVFIEEKISIAKVMGSFLHEAQEKAKSEHLVIPQSMHTIMVGGERLPEETMAFAKSRFKKIFIVYGSTECMTVGTSLTGGKEINLKPYSYTPIPYTEVKVTDTAGGILPRGTPGTLWIRSPYKYKGYLLHKGPENDENGWVNTSDAVVMDTDGKIAVVGRIHDVIRIGKTETYPVAFEGTIRQIPDVDECVVFGVPPGEKAQDVCVCAKLRPGATADEEALHQWCDKFQKEGSIPEVPKYVIIMEEFPKLSNGKTNRHEMAIMIMEHLDIDYQEVHIK